MAVASDGFSRELLLVVPALVDELKSIAIEVGNIRGVVARSKVCAFGGLTFVAAAGRHGRFVGRINRFAAVTHYA
jgi:hypothetical protein